MKKLGFFILFYFFLSLNLYAFESNISVTKEEIGLNDYTKIRVQVNHDNTKDIEIKEVKGLDNFVILNKTSGTSSSSNIVLVDGKTTTQSESSDFIDLTLSPKKAGTFELGPAIVESNDEKKETNKVSIKVSEAYKQKYNSNYFGKENKNDSYLFSIIFFIFLFFIIVLIYYFKKDLFSKFYEKNIYKLIKKDQKIEEKIQEIKPDIILDYPPLEDENFTIKINDIFINKIKTKYYIENIEKKSNEEIHSLIPDDLSDKENIGKIISLLNKLKYSKEDIEKNEIIELLKKI